MESIVSAPPFTMSDTQSALLDKFRELVAQHNIKLEIDPAEFNIQSPCAIDVEHDEQGNMVCIGVYDGYNSYCFTKITAELKRQLEI